MTKTSFLDGLAWAYNLLKVSPCYSVMNQNEPLQKGDRNITVLYRVKFCMSDTESVASTDTSPGSKPQNFLFRELVENRELGRCTAVTRPNNDGRPSYISYIKLKRWDLEQYTFSDVYMRFLKQFILKYYGASRRWFAELQEFPDLKAVSIRLRSIMIQYNALPSLSGI